MWRCYRKRCVHMCVFHLIWTCYVAPLNDVYKFFNKGHKPLGWNPKQSYWIGSHDCHKKWSSDTKLFHKLLDITTEKSKYFKPNGVRTCSETVQFHNTYILTGHKNNFFFLFAALNHVANGELEVEKGREIEKKSRMIFYQWTILRAINHERQPTEFNSIRLVVNVSSISNFAWYRFSFSLSVVLIFSRSRFHMLMLNNVYIDAQCLIFTQFIVHSDIDNVDGVDNGSQSTWRAWVPRESRKKSPTVFEHCVNNV